MGEMGLVQTGGEQCSSRAAAAVFSCPCSYVISETWTQCCGAA